AAAGVRGNGSRVGLRPVSRPPSALSNSEAHLYAARPVIFCNAGRPSGGGFCLHEIEVGMSPNILHRSALAASVVSLAAAAIAFGQPDRTPPRGPAGMPPPPEVNPAAVHNREALRRL